MIVDETYEVYFAPDITIEGSYCGMVVHANGTEYHVFAFNKEDAAKHSIGIGFFQLETFKSSPILNSEDRVFMNRVYETITLTYIITHYNNFAWVKEEDIIETGEVKLSFMIKRLQEEIKC